MTTRFQFVRLLCLFVLAVLGVASGQAAEPRVTGRLSSTTTSVGETVDYTLTIEGTLDTHDAPVPTVDGLEVRDTSHGSQLSIVNGDVSRRTTITYRLAPKREGAFTIPPLEVSVGGRVLRTREQTLTVTAGRPTAAAGDLAFAEIRLGKKKAYIGEAVPIEVRLYLDNGARWNLRNRPVISGSGFTLQPFGEVTQRVVEMAGKSYTAATFHSLITPGRAGKITIGPVPMNAVYSTQEAAPFGFFPRRSGARAQELEITAPAVEMEAELLPTAGRPADFTGAIGKFELEAIGTPNRVNVGEPVQMVVTLRGEGNFDRIDTPPLADPTGWRVYDAEQRFEPSDDLGYSGTKTFSLPVAPSTRKTTMPVFAFNYFDPSTGKYESLKSAVRPLTVTGAEPTVAAATTPTEATPATAPAATPAADILGILPEVGPAWSPGITFAPGVMLALVAAPIPALAALVIWRRRRGDVAAGQRAQWRREKGELQQKLRAGGAREELYEMAARILQIEAALQSGKEPHACDLPDILAARKLTPETERRVEELFESRAALVYAGGQTDAGALPMAERDRLLETLAQYERSDAR